MLNAKAKARLDQRLALLLKRLNEKDFATIKSTTERILATYVQDQTKGADAFCNRTLLYPSWREAWESGQGVSWAWFTKSNANPLEADPLNRRGWEALKEAFRRMIALVVEGTTPYHQRELSNELKHVLCKYLALQGLDVSCLAHQPGPALLPKACRKKTRRGPYNKAVTSRQMEVYEAYTRHGCNAQKAAVELSITPQAVSRNVAIVKKKLPGVVRNKLQPKTQRLKHDRRGQPNVPQPD
jgi:hypothetical protein